MQANPKTQDNHADAERSLKKESIELVATRKSNEALDDAELSAVEAQQTETIVVSTQVISSPRSMLYIQQDSRLYTSILTFGSVLVVVAVYATLVFI